MGRLSKYIDAIKTGGRLSVPRQIYVELTGSCNLRCPGCPRTYSNAVRGPMSDQMFLDIVRCIADECPEFLSIGLHGFGEIETKNGFDVLIHEARKILPGLKVGVSTTLSLRNPALIDRLLLSVNAIGVWPDAPNKAIYDQIRVGGDWDLVFPNIKLLFSRRKVLGREHVGIGVGMVIYEKNKAHIEEFKRTFSYVEREPNAALVFNESHDWAGQIPNVGVIHSLKRERIRLRKPCLAPFGTLVFMSDGRVSSCCRDMDGQLVIGDFSTTKSIKGILNSPDAIRFRRRMLRLRHPLLCRNCEMGYLTGTRLKRAFCR